MFKIQSLNKIISFLPDSGVHRSLVIVTKAFSKNGQNTIPAEKQKTKNKRTEKDNQRLVQQKLKH